MRKVINVYNTHIEIHPYHLGENPQLEHTFSTYDAVEHHYNPIGYCVCGDTLYLPRGTNLSKLEYWFRETPHMVTKHDVCDRVSMRYEMKNKPRGKIQTDAIDFLTGRGNYGKSKRYNQLSLNLDTGDGKTFCCISAASMFGLKTIIITHKKKIRDQWNKEFLERTNINEDQIFVIRGKSDMKKIMDGKVEADIYLVNHQTLHSYARLHGDTGGWMIIKEFFKKIRVGLKIIDEAHLFFENTLMIDFFSNTKQTFYITATFTRSDYRENRIFSQAFSSVYRFGEETFEYEEKRKHIMFVVVYFHTSPDQLQLRRLTTKYGFSVFRYIDYEMKENPENTMMRVIRELVRKMNHLDGKILINSPKIETVKMIAEDLKEVTDKSIGMVYSKNGFEENRKGYNSDIISSTIKSTGVGDDIPGLRVLINTEPIASSGRMDQLKGRLREYAKDKDTYLFHLVDTSVEQNMVFLNRVLPMLQKKCKKIISISFDF